MDMLWQLFEISDFFLKANMKGSFYNENNMMS